MAAICTELNAPYEMPVMPTLPLHQGCFDSQSITWSVSWCSFTAYSSSGKPSDAPVPRTSSRIPA